VSDAQLCAVACVLVRALIVNVATADDRCDSALVVDALLGRADIRVQAVVCRKTTARNRRPRTDIISTPVVGARVVVIAVSCSETTSRNHWVLTHPHNALVVRTRVGVVAGDRKAIAQSICAHVSGGTSIIVIAGVAVDDVELAFTGFGVARVGGAGVSSRRTGDLGGLVDHTDHLLADQCSVAQVAVLELVAVFVRLALAGDSLADTCLVLARVIDCARVAVVARCDVRCEHAVTFNALVVRTRVGVVAGDLQTLIRQFVSRFYVWGVWGDLSRGNDSVSHDRLTVCVAVQIVIGDDVHRCVRVILAPVVWLVDFERATHHGHKQKQIAKERLHGFPS